ncbi:MAG TPA: hypothetical protein VII48_12090 [Rhizomicrobium sp.]
MHCLRAAFRNADDTLELSPNDLAGYHSRPGGGGCFHGAFYFFAVLAIGAVSRPFLVLRAGKPVIHATWTSPDSASLDIAGDDVSIDHACDSFGGVWMDYTLHETPARD